MHRCGSSSPAPPRPPSRASNGSPASGHEVVAVVTATACAARAASACSRPSPVAAGRRAARHPRHRREPARRRRDRAHRGARPDLGVIVAYGGLVREPLLSTPRARLDQPALLAAARVARRRARAARAHRGRRDDRRRRVPARPRARRRRRVRDERRAADRRRRDGRHAARGARRRRRRARSPRVVDGIAAGTRGRDAAARASRRSRPKLDDRRRPARLDASRRVDVDARFRGVTPEPGAFTEVDGVRAEGARGAHRHGAGCRASALPRPAPCGSPTAACSSAPADGDLELARGAARRAHRDARRRLVARLGVDEAVAR